MITLQKAQSFDTTSSASPLRLYLTCLVSMLLLSGCQGEQSAQQQSCREQFEESLQNSCCQYVEKSSEYVCRNKCFSHPRTVCVFKMWPMGIIRSVSVRKSVNGPVNSQVTF